MVKTRDDSSLVVNPSTIVGASGPVVLGTLSLRPDPSAEQMAIGAQLLFVNAVQLPPYPTTMMVGGLGAMVLPHEDDREAVVESAERIAALGIDVELIGLLTPRPVRGLLELAQERGAALIVFGPLLSKIGRIRMRRAARRIRREAGCLVWIAPDG